MSDARGRLTPLSSELKHQEPVRPGRRTLLERVRGRRRRAAPTTVLGMIGQGLLRLGIALGVGSLLAWLVDDVAGRPASFGFYVVGAFVLASGVLMSAGDAGTPTYYRQGERERRVSLSFSYVLAGLLVVCIGVAIDAL